jgi:hypothetical protein
MDDKVQDSFAELAGTQNDPYEIRKPEFANGRSEWVSPKLKEFGSLSFVVKGISYNPLDGISNLTP